MGEAEAAAWVAAAGSVGSVGAGGTDGSRVPWSGEEDLVRGQDEEPWPALVFSMSPN